MTMPLKVGKPWLLSSLQTTVASCRVQLLSHTGDHTPSLLHISTSWRLLLFTSLTTVTLPSGHNESVNQMNARVCPVMNANKSSKMTNSNTEHTFLIPQLSMQQYAMKN